MKQVLFGLALVSLLAMAGAAFAVPTLEASASEPLQLNYSQWASVYFLPCTTIETPTPDPVTGNCNYSFTLPVFAQANFPYSLSWMETEGTSPNPTTPGTFPGQNAMTPANDTVTQANVPAGQTVNGQIVLTGTLTPSTAAGSYYATVTVNLYTLN